MATVNDLIDEIRAEMPDPIPEGQQFIDLDDQVPNPVRLPADESWVEILNDAKAEFEVDGATAVFSTWRVEAEDPLDIGDVEIADGAYVRGGRLALDARMTDHRATQILAALPEGEFLLRIKFMRDGTKMNGSLKTSLTQCDLREKRGRALSRLQGMPNQVL